MSGNDRQRHSIGVVIPARNAGRYIGAAIDSVLGQTVRAAEVVVVDDGSSDDTAAIVRGFGASVKLLSQPPSGPAAARNRGLREIHADRIALLDADDLWPADSLTVRNAALDADPAADLCFGQMVQFASPELPEAERLRLVFDSAPHPAWAPIGDARPAFRLRSVRAAARAPPRRAISWSGCSARARAGARAIVVDEVVLKRRLHLDNLTGASGRRIPTTSRSCARSSPGGALAEADSG